MRSAPCGDRQGPARTGSVPVGFSLSRRWEVWFNSPSAYLKAGGVWGVEGVCEADRPPSLGLMGKLELVLRPIGWQDRRGDKTKDPSKRLDHPPGGVWVSVTGSFGAHAFWEPVEVGRRPEEQGCRLSSFRPRGTGAWERKQPWLGQRFETPGRPHPPPGELSNGWRHLRLSQSRAGHAPSCKHRPAPVRQDDPASNSSRDGRP